MGDLNLLDSLANGSVSWELLVVCLERFGPSQIIVGEGEGRDMGHVESQGKARRYDTLKFC
jgi:hypothetical protein